MAQRQYPHELRIHTTVDPPAAAACLARSATFGSFVVYERHGVWTFAGGAAGEVILDRAGFRVRWGAHERRLPVSHDPSRDLARIMADAPVEDWSLYGWAGFEYAYAQAGMRDLLDDGTLLHMVVPQVEIKMSANHVVLRGSDHRLLQILADVVQNAPADPYPEPSPVSVDEIGADAYRDAVAAVVRDIDNGKLRKAIVSRAVPVAFDVDLVATYLVGRRHNTPSRSFLLRLGDLTAAGFSPETVVEVDPDGSVRSHPLAGTRAFFPLDRARTARLRADLLGDPKEVFEHAISVQLACEELARICAPDSVRVEEFMNVLERGSVQHLASAVSGRLAVGMDSWDAFAALFPAVTASGIPKRAAFEAIHRYEPGPRGLYSGAVLTADARGGLDAALVLRTVFRRADRTWLQAGAGIVAGSTPARELEETCEKMRSVAQFLVPESATAMAAG
ncbi:salicylate synthase [Embleya sp. NPDC050493]|uniref:salicylate synthase n=1 Tax=Embleya sp. NPDC050493 TaxID=3363989 RepID=UPI00379280BA